jgi:hypothetical protein
MNKGHSLIPQPAGGGFVRVGHGSSLERATAFLVLVAFHIEWLANEIQDAKQAPQSDIFSVHVTNL